MTNAINTAFADGSKDDYHCIKRWYADTQYPAAPEYVVYSCSRDAGRLLSDDDRDVRPGPAGEREFPCDKRRCPWTKHNDKDPETLRLPRHPLTGELT